MFDQVVFLSNGDKLTTESRQVQDMGKKTEKPAASSSDETSTCPPEQQQTETKRRKTRAMAVLGEYMRYFGGVNGLYRNIVQRQAEVVSRHGRNGWRTLSQTDQDQAFDSHIVTKFVTSEKCNSDNLDEGNSTENAAGLSKNKGKVRRDSMQSYTEFDGFSGPFSWKSKSLQDLTFPPTPDMNDSRKLMGQKKASKKEEKDLIKLEVSEGSEASESEEEVIPYITLDQLRKNLRRNYEEQQAARLKMRQMEAEKNPGSPKKPEKITKTAVLERQSSLKSPCGASGKKPELKRLQISAADLKSASALKPVNRERLRTTSQIENGSLSHDGPSPIRSPPETAPRPRPHHRTEPITLKQSPHRKSQEFDEILFAAEESHRKRTQTSSSKIGTSLRHDSISSNGKSSRSGSISINSNSPDKKLTVKEISEDWNQYFSQKSSAQSPSATGNSDLMDLFKDW